MSQPRRRQRVRKLQVHDEAVTAFGVVAHAVQLGEAGGGSRRVIMRALPWYLSQILRIVFILLRNHNDIGRCSQSDSTSWRFHPPMVSPSAGFPFAGQSPSAAAGRHGSYAVA